jgi:hypothetical protein
LHLQQLPDIDPPDDRYEKNGQHVLGDEISRRLKFLRDNPEYMIYDPISDNGMSQTFDLSTGHFVWALFVDSAYPSHANNVKEFQDPKWRLDTQKWVQRDGSHMFIGSPALWSSSKHYYLSWPRVSHHHHGVGWFY